MQDYLDNNLTIALISKKHGLTKKQVEQVFKELVEEGKLFAMPDRNLEDRIQRGVNLGLSAKDISNLTAVKYGSVRTLKHQLIRKGRLKIEKALEAKTFDNIVDYSKHPKIYSDSLLIIADLHVPYVSPVWLDYALQIGDKLGTIDVLILGDFFHFDTFSSFVVSLSAVDLQNELLLAAGIIDLLLSRFRRVILIPGNHERRLWKLTDGKLSHIDIIQKISYSEKVFLTDYSYIEVNDSWLMCHPTNFSKIRGKVPVTYAGIYHKNILTGHQHHSTITYDISGVFQAVDVGCLVDKRYIRYYNIDMSSKSKWINGFAVLRKNHIYIFDEKTDFDFWLSLQINDNINKKYNNTLKKMNKQQITRKKKVKKRHKKVN